MAIEQTKMSKISFAGIGFVINKINGDIMMLGGRPCQAASRIEAECLALLEDLQKMAKLKHSRMQICTDAQQILKISTDLHSDGTTHHLYCFLRLHFNPN